ncbi:CD44 antigen isoform X31 [Gallus gallus]|uniref:CD44 antigen isoform X31 n=1 Tax=Gallus gallus TaxID=9031 RepID=UPI001F003B6A|nr:CD44 antigen isoform X31 [Gallus gallus]
MANFYLLATFGLCLLKFCLTETQFNITCRYGGVFHVEKNGRYSLTRAEAIELCRALNSTLATLEQFERAHALGFETCRYGFIVGHIVIPRINPYHLCAANHTGIYKLSANTTGRYDAYCYNATETRSKACEPIERIDITFLSNQSEIVIDNEDGSRYNADGTRHSGDSSTSGVDDENLGSGSIHDTTPGDASIRRSSPSYYGSVTPYSHMPDHSSGGGEKDFPVKHYDDEISPTSTDILATAADFPREDDVQHPASTTVDSQHETLLEVSTQDYWKPYYTDEEERYPSSAGRALVTSETEKRQGPTQHPLLHSVHYGWISQGQNPANTTGATEQQEFTPPGENDIEKETSYTAMVPNHGAKQNDSAQDPLVYPGWGKEDYSIQPTIMDRVIPSRESNREKESSNTALATPDRAPHEDPTQPTLPSGNEAAQSTEGTTHSTDAPGGPVLLGLDPVSTNEAGDESLLTVTVSTDVFHAEEATSRPLAPSTQPGSESEQANATGGSHVSLIPGVFPDIDEHLNPLPTHLSTTLATPDRAPHEDPTQPTLPSGNEAAQSTEGTTRSADAPGGPVLLGLDPISTNEAGDESLLTGTITDSNDVLKPEDVTQEAWTPRVINTALATPDDGHHEDPTQPTLPSDIEAAQSTEGTTHSTDAPGGPVLLGLDPVSTNEAGDESLLTGTITVSTDVFHAEEATSRPLAPSTQPGSESEQANATGGSHVSLIPGVFPDMDDRLYQLPTPPPSRSTSNIDSDQGPHKGDGEPTSSPGLSTTTTVTSQPGTAHVPEWLIIVAALLALALILAVCIAVNSQRRCGQKKKLVINNGKGAVEDRKTRELNGDASKSQEMVHLVHKEQSNDRTGACDEFLTVDETQNHQDGDMKSGV